MGLRWDWLQPLMTAPYVPALGPAHPQAVTPGLFANIVQVAGTGRFLPHDKDRRWVGRKDEHVLVGTITQEPGLVLIPTLSTRRVSCIRVHIYSQAPARRAEPGRRAGPAAVRAARRREGAAHLVPAAGQRPRSRRRLHPHPDAHLQPRRSPHPAPCPVSSRWTRSPNPSARRSACSRRSWPLRASHSSMPASASTAAPARCSPVQRDGAIVGAIGPMEIMPDSRGAAQAAAAVLRRPARLPRPRPRPSPWRAAMHWGQQHQAAYQLLQTEAGGASDRLCRSEGLTDLGLVCTSML